MDSVADSGTGGDAPPPITGASTDREDEDAGMGLLADGRRRREPQTITRPVPALIRPAQAPASGTLTRPCAHPDETPGPALRKAWDRRAWAEGRPDKVNPQPGANVTQRWLAELADLGYRDRNVPVALTPTPVGMFDRDGAAETAVARAGATRSAWNPADLRG